MVIAACDAFHAMTSDRSYRTAMSLKAAEAELRANAGTQFEPGVIAALLAELAGDAPIN
jgi:HD-GYP domain-containing protein (c-di-GMP phosphodiesterase class II)